MNALQWIQLGQQVMPLLDANTASKIQAGRPQIIAGAINGAVANAAGGTSGMEAGAAAGAINALIHVLQGK